MSAWTQASGRRPPSMMAARLLKETAATLERGRIVAVAGGVGLLTVGSLAYRARRGKGKKKRG